MRHYRYDVRDMLQAFVLAFDIRRVMCGTLAIAWTIVVILLFYGIFAWRAASGNAPDYNASEVAWRMLTDTQPTPERIALWAGMLGVWWLGFSCMATPILRSGAMEVALDRRLKFADMSAASRHLAPRVTWAPLIAMFVPTLMLGLCALWALLAKIPGVAGEICTLVGLPFALLFGFIGGLALLTTLLAAPLMGPAAVVEGHDVLEALSRAVSYLYQRPFRFLGYALFQLIGKVAALAFSALVLCLSWGFVAVGLYIVGEGALAEQSVRLALAPGSVFPAPEATSGVPHVVILPAARMLAGLFWSTALFAAGWWLVVVLGMDLFRYLLLRYEVDGVTYNEIMDPQQYMAAHKHLNAIESAEQAAKSREETPTPAPATPAPVETKS
ncbi:MAG: hypothetical protein IT462_08795 [Planctomycetes bacterium]|nr:hypothetical protein [Planctomycetota bacterium]